MLEKARFSGMTFIDVDKRDDDWSFPDYNCDRIPVKGEVMCFRHIVGNNNDIYYGEVLLVIDHREMWGNNVMRDCEIKTHSIYVLLKEIKGKLGNETYNTLLNHFKK